MLVRVILKTCSLKIPFLAFVHAFCQKNVTNSLQVLAQLRTALSISPLDVRGSSSSNTHSGNVSSGGKGGLEARSGAME